MFQRKLFLVLLLVLILILSLTLIARAKQCPLSSEPDCYEQGDGFRAGVVAARQDLFLDLNLGFWTGPFAFAPDLLSSVCYKGKTSYCNNRSDLPWWRADQVSYDSPRYRQDFKRGYWQQTQGGNSKGIAKLVGWGSSLAVILAVGVICCGGG